MISGRKDYDQDSHEFLTAIRDPYSSADEQKSIEESDQHLKNRICHQTTKLASGKNKDTKKCNYTVHTFNLIQVKESFHINFIAIPKEPTLKQFIELQTDDVLQSLLLFCSKETITASEAIAAVLKLKVCNPILKWLHHYKSYDFPDKYDGNEVHLQEEFPWVKEFVEGITSQAKYVQTNKHDNNVKSFLNQFFSLAWEGIMDTDQSTVSLTLTEMEGIGDYYPHKGYIKPEYAHIVTAKPDIVIGNNYKYPVIPVEVYSPPKFMKNTYNIMENDKSEAGMPYSLPSSKDDSNLAEIRKFLMSNLPCPCEDCSSLGNLCRFKQTLTEQLLVQLLGFSHNYLRKKRYSCFQKRTHSFIGFFAFNFHIYIIKLEGTSDDIDEVCSGRRDWHIENKGNYPLNISFYPVPLDVSNFVNGIALLFLIRYYRRILNG